MIRVRPEAGHWVVAVDFVCGREDKGGEGGELPCRFKQVERSVGVDGEVCVGIASRPVVRRLGRRVNDCSDIPAEFLKQRIDCVGVADIDRAMLVSGDALLKLSPAPVCGSSFAEERLSHVVVDSDNLISLAGKEANRFGPDQAGGPCDHNDAHESPRFRNQ